MALERKRKAKYRARILRDAWRGRARVAHPGDDCPYGRQAPANCSGCVEGKPCKLEVTLWNACERAARDAGMSPASAALLASLQLRLGRMNAEGEPDSELFKAETRLLGVQLDFERTQARLRHAREKLQLRREASRQLPYSERLAQLLAPVPAVASIPAAAPTVALHAAPLDVPASPQTKPASGAPGAPPVGAVAMPAEQAAEPEPQPAGPEPAVPTAAEPAPPAARWPAGLPPLDDEPTYF